MMTSGGQSLEDFADGSRAQPGNSRGCISTWGLDDGDALPSLEDLLDPHDMQHFQDTPAACDLGGGLSDSQEQQPQQRLYGIGARQDHTRGEHQLLQQQQHSHRQQPQRYDGHNERSMYPSLVDRPVQQQHQPQAQHCHEWQQGIQQSSSTHVSGYTEPCNRQAAPAGQWGGNNNHHVRNAISEETSCRGQSVVLQQASSVGAMCEKTRSDSIGVSNSSELLPTIDAQSAGVTALPHAASHNRERGDPGGSLVSSGSRSPPDFGDDGKGFTLGSLGQSDMAAPDSPAAKNKNRIAQKKFRERQKDRILGWNRQVDELSSQVLQLQLEKGQLQQRSRILEASLAANTHHEERLHCDQEIMEREQLLLGRDTAEFLSRIESRPVTTAAAMALPMKQLADVTFPGYVGRLRHLLEASSREPLGAAAREVDALITMRRVHEERRALFSCFTWAAFAWNREMLTVAGSPPSAPFWAEILVGLQLTPGQVANLRAARQALVGRLAAIAAERQGIVSHLALQLLQLPPDEWLRCGVMLPLQQNLGMERQAVFSFCFAWFDETLTAVQEATLECQCYPWCPDLWEMCAALERQLQTQLPKSAKRGSNARLATIKTEPEGQDDADGLCADLAVDSLGALNRLLPLYSGFRLLREPALVHGVGGRLKRGILADPYETVVPSEAFPLPTVAQLTHMNLHDIQCGRYRTEMFGDWMQRNLPDGMPIPI